MSIDQLVDNLPTGGLTVRALKLFDSIVPGEWDNLVGFDNSIRQITGESDDDTVSRVRDRALTLYNDPSQGYQRAISIYGLVNSSGTALGWAAAAHKLGESFSALSFLDRLTPKPEKAQAIDLAMKIVAESAAFCYTNGLPGDSVSDFAGALASYSKDNLIRIASIVTFDGIIPLGDAFFSKFLDVVSGLSASDVEENPFFQRARHLLPGDGLDLVTRNVGAVGDYVGNFASAHGITREGILGGMRGFIDLTEDKLEYLGAFLDMSLNYMEHTGTQSVARSLIERAVGEI
ncbi:hypothetical protein [Paludibaculum fermentans]|uniref:Uncharacterized protein n=1 Tax=Paludibaculum fermentans TaxID=1473598 RepID=A0A7S7NQ86_PALFE|nr:hypothetical protein [Paludibaculum fermentans]QOY87761.1 hypothetical protein IRI77_34305 [Paludibaculum fermentans]